MSVSLEQRQTVPTLATSGDEALMIIDTYRREVDEHFSVEPLEVEFPGFARELGGNVSLARAGDNEAGAFKWRGALYGAYKLQQLGVERLIVPPAGNHARGAALAARALNMSVRVVVPETTPDEKNHKIKELWNSPKLQVIAHGDTFDESLNFARSHYHTSELLHPYDNADVIAGQGTLADDILSHAPNTKHIVVPIGGGGLASGILARLEDLDRRDVAVHAVEAPGSNSLSRSLAAERLTAAENPNQRFGGSAVSRIGAQAFTAAMHHPNFEVISHVVEHDVNQLIGSYEQDRADLWRRDVAPYEPTSLVAVAGLGRVLAHLKNNGNETEPVVVIGTGHNAPLQQPKPPSSYLWRSPARR